MSAFLSDDLLTDFAAFCLTDYIDWRYIHSVMCIFDPACELLPPWTQELYGTCELLPLYCTFSLTSSPLPPFPMYSIYRQSVTVGGGGGCWNVLWTIFCWSLHSVSDQFQNLQIASPPQAKMTTLKKISVMSSLGRYVFGSEISYNKAPPRLPGLGC